MLATQFMEAARVARRGADLDHVVRLAYRATAEGAIEENALSGVLEAVEARRETFRSGYLKSKLPASAFRNPVQRSPDREKSIRRRRATASSGMMPPSIASMFTTGEQAALSVVARQVQTNSRCDWCLDRIAAVAGVSRSTARNAIRQARMHGLIQVTERRRRGTKSDTNIVEIISKDWMTWLKLGGQHRGQKNDLHGNSKKIETSLEMWMKANRGYAAVAFGVRSRHNQSHEIREGAF